MKPLPNQRLKQHANTLFVTLFLTAIIGVILVSYLTVTSLQYSITVRSEAYNFALPVVEAGIEEALSHLNENGMTNVLLPQNPLPYIYNNGWVATNGVAVMRRSIGTARYVVSISSTGAAPVIECVAYTPAPVRLAGGGNAIFATVGANPTASAEVQRAVRVTAKTNPLFKYALVVKKFINSNGNSSLVDAFDSANPLYSTNGKYDAAKAQDGGGVATLSSLANQLSFGSIQVFGRVATAPGGSISIPAWDVGTHAWIAANAKGIQPGMFTTDFNASFPDVQAPFASALPPTGATVGGIGYAYVLSSGNWMISSGTVHGKVLVTGDATLYVTKNAAVSFVSTDSITISTNASLRLYVGSPTATLPNLVNTNTPDKFVYFGLPTNTNLVQNVNADFVGSVYAPSAKYTLGGNGTGSEQKISGASITDSVYFNDFFTFHYDLNLARVGLSTGFVANSWSEVDPTTLVAR